MKAFFIGMHANFLTILIVICNVCVTGLFSTGFNANTLLKSDWTGLMYACDGGHEAIVKLLLSYGADPNYIKGDLSLFNGI